MRTSLCVENNSSPCSASVRGGRGRGALTLALAACAGLGACVQDDAAPPPPPPDQGSSQLAQKLTAQAQRAQAYLDEHVIPDLDRALRETAGVSYADLLAELTEIASAGDAAAVKAGLDRFVAARHDIIQAAVARMGTTTEAITAAIQRAALGDEPEVVAQVQIPPPQ